MYQPGTPPPIKKRRFFNDLNAQAKESGQLPAPQEADSVTEFPGTEDVPTGCASPTADVDVPHTGGFDLALFASIIGEKLPSSELKKLSQISGGDMERAINMYFDGSWKDKNTTFQSGLPIRESTSHPQKRKASSPSDSENSSHEFCTPSNPSSLMRGPRFIGTFGVEGWATRSGSKLIAFNEKVNIARQKIQNSSMKGKDKRKSAAPIKYRKTLDIVVRFTNSRGEEVGRLSQDKAVFISTLLDQNVCSFTGICIYAPEHIRTNDTIHLQLNCFLLPSAFEERRLNPLHDNHVADLFVAQETEEEKGLRLRQTALVRIFEEVNLQPVRTNEITAKHKRVGLLQAAEVAEQYENAKSGDDSCTHDQESGSEDNEGKELEQDHLDALYRKAQAFDWNSPEAEPVDTFILNLRRYQKQALYWLLSKEKGEESKRSESMHPLWEEFAWPTKDEHGSDISSEGQEMFYVNPYSGDLSLKFPRQEQNCLGGILADEMGLGKTIEMLSLVHSHKSDLALNISSSASRLPKMCRTSSEVEFAPCTTLVVAPMSLLAQWQSEAEKASAPGSMKTLIYYGTDKNVNLQALCSRVNVGSAPSLIITSYGTVLSEFSSMNSGGVGRGDSGGLYSVKFFRLILDEGHHIKNRASKTARACYELSAQHRWVLTGTPIINRLEDLFSLVRFLRLEPWSNFSFWRTFITVPFESKDFIRALDVVQTVLEPLVLRRTKNMKQSDGTPLVPLPSKRVIIEEVELSKQEREVYDHILTRAKRTFTSNVEAGTVMKAYTTIFAQILRLRQSCCHPRLVRRKEVAADELEEVDAPDANTGFSDDIDLQDLINQFTATEENEGGEKNPNSYGTHVLKQISEEAEQECPICAEEKMVDMVVTGCFHATCKRCLQDHIEYEKNHNKVPKCVTCREEINERDIFEVLKEEEFPASSLISCPSASTGSKSLFSPTSSKTPVHSTLLSKETTSSPAPTPTSSPQFVLRRLTSRSSAKIEALLSRLKSLRLSHPTSKAIIFSQFTSFLDLLSPALTRAKIAPLRFDGTMSQSSRAQVLSRFNSHQGFTVLLISLRAGGVGLNLTQARWVFMMEPWWSYAVEEQAIDRVHRMGQTEEVTVWRYVVKDSVEERMIGKIQAKKKFIAGSLGMVSEEEKRLQRIEDIQDLLS